MSRDQSKPTADSEQEPDGPNREFWRVATPFREPVSTRWFVPAALALLAIATPWYLPHEVASRFWHGLPVWVWIALASALSLSILTCYGALALWRDADPDQDAAQLESREARS